MEVDPNHYFLVFQSKMGIFWLQSLLTILRPPSVLWVLRASVSVYIRKCHPENFSQSVFINLWAHISFSSLLPMAAPQLVSTITTDSSIYCLFLKNSLFGLPSPNWLGVTADNDPLTHMASADAQCPICLDIVRDPVQAQCPHMFCRQCLNEWFL